jgi:hypothetical protein
MQYLHFYMPALCLILVIPSIPVLPKDLKIYVQHPRSRKVKGNVIWSKLNQQ